MSESRGRFKKEIARLCAPFQGHAVPAIPSQSSPGRAILYGAGALALMLLFVVQGNRNFFAVHLAPSLLPGAAPEQIEWWGSLYQFAAAFVLFFVVPALLLWLAGRERLSDLGLGLGDVKAGLLVALVGLSLIALPGGLMAGEMPDFRAEYPLSRLAFSSWDRLVLYELAYGLVFYVAWEAFFRGFLQLGLRPHLGDPGAILVQTMASTLLHIGKPTGELWAALAAGFLFGVLVLRTRSVWPLVLIHWGLGLMTDLSCAHALGIWP